MEDNSVTGITGITCDDILAADSEEDEFLKSLEGLMKGNVNPHYLNLSGSIGGMYSLRRITYDIVVSFGEGTAKMNTLLVRLSEMASALSWHMSIGICDNTEYLLYDTLSPRLYHHDGNVTEYIYLTPISSDAVKAYNNIWESPHISIIC